MISNITRSADSLADTGEETWEPYENMAETEALDEYERLHWTGYCISVVCSPEMHKYIIRTNALGG